MALAYIGLGSNLDQPQQQLNIAKDAINGLPDTQVTACSSIYQSQAITLDEVPQSDFLNAVIEIDTGLTAESLMDALLLLESQQGRVREKRWGPRTIDMDIILYADKRINTQNLTLPHVEMENRLFVLLPLYEIAPDIDIPGKEKLKALINRVADQSLQQVGKFNG